MIRHAEVAGEPHALEPSLPASFIAGLPGMLAEIIQGNTVSSRCGAYLIERTNEGGVKLSRAASLILLAHLNIDRSEMAADVATLQAIDILAARKLSPDDAAANPLMEMMILTACEFRDRELARAGR